MNWSKNIEQAEQQILKAEARMSPSDPQFLVLASIANSLIDIAKSLDIIVKRGNGQP